MDYLERHSVGGFDFGDFLETVGALLMGSTSYIQAVEWGWLWGEFPTMVLTSRPSLPVPADADVRFANLPTPHAIRSFAAETPKRLWVFGGGQVITEGLRGGAIDTLDLMVMPETLGSGIPLFAAPYDGPMRLISATTYDSAVRLIYDVRPG